MTNLTHLYLYDNQLTGLIPSEINNLSSLNYFWINDNQFIGELPCNICEMDLEWDNPELVKMSENQFCPPYPDCIASNIDIQDTSNCNSVPQRQFDLWGECYMIENTDSLNLGNTGLTGTIPPEIGNLINLEYLFLYGNELTGEIPEEIGGLTNLKHLYLYDNGLTGQLPSSIGGLSSLTHLFLYGNALSLSLIHI